MALKTEFGEYKSLPVLAVKGRIIDVDANKFSKKLKALMNTKKDSVVIDMSEVSFIDSYGLGILVYYSNLMQKEGKKFIICNTNRSPQAYLKRLFDITNLNKILTIVNAPEEIRPES